MVNKFGIRLIVIIMLGLTGLLSLSVLGFFLILRNPDSLWAVGAFWLAVQSIDVIIAPTAWDHGMRIRKVARRVGMNRGYQNMLQTMANPMKNAALAASGFVLMAAGVFQQRVWLILCGSLIVALFVGLAFHLSAKIRFRVIVFLRLKIVALALTDNTDGEKAKTADNLLELYQLLKW